MSKYAKHVAPGSTPQSEPIRADQVENSAGGYGWAVDDWTRLDRFLILGAEGGTYYATERKLTKENAAAVIRCIKEDGPRVVARVEEISTKGRASKNDPALFVLALAFAEGDPETRAAARAALPKIARIGTHLFQFLGSVDQLRGWGRGLRNSVADWYDSKDLDGLAYQAVKYKERNGWSHTDALRLSHPKTKDPARSALYRQMVGKVVEPESVPAIIGAANEALTANPKRIVELIKEHNLPREVLPTESLTKPEVWEALLEKMPMTAMIRNLATMTRVGLIKDLGTHTNTICDRIVNVELIRKGRIHPIQILSALLTYRAGKSARGSNTWAPVGKIVDALDAAFYLSFETVEPTGKRILYGLDVSSSMDGGEVGGVPGLTPRVASSALAMVAAKTEANVAFMAFTTAFSPIDIGSRKRLDDVCSMTDKMPFGGTDCALPMLYADQHKLDVDSFVILTDSETWAGAVHPSEALKQYRRHRDIPAKLVVCGMVSNGFTIADPNDAGMMDCVGFSTDTPVVMSDFIKN